MNSKKDIKILSDLLDLKDVLVISHRIHAGIGIILQTESRLKESNCPICGTSSHRLHQNHRHIIKDLPFGEKPVFLEINRRQFKCEKCKKPFSEELSFARKKRTYTSRLAPQTIQEVLENDIHSVASKGIVTTEEIEKMLKDVSEELLNSKPVGLTRLGIDEIALVKGKSNYCAVLVDLDRSKLIAILDLRTKEIIKETLLEWRLEVLEEIKEVSIDLWKGYKTIVKELMPNAQVVADRFHVMAIINQELDRQTIIALKAAKSASKKAEKQKTLDGIIKSKYVLLKNEENLNNLQKNKLIEVKSVSPTLQIMHELKDKFRKNYNKKTDWYTAVFKMGMWLSKAKKYFPKSNNTIIRWFDEIIAYFDNRTTSGVV